MKMKKKNKKRKRRKRQIIKRNRITYFENEKNFKDYLLK